MGNENTVDTVDIGLHNDMVKLTFPAGRHIESNTVEAHLLLAILEKLEEIRCGGIDIEDEIRFSREEHD